MSPEARKRFCCDDDLAIIGSEGLYADDHLELWRSGRLPAWTAELIEVVRAEGIKGTALLDIGAGVGAVHLTLLEAGAASAVDVDASREFLAVARAEAERRGLADKVDYRYGDLVELAPDLPPADIVTMDSVICCYPYLAPPLEAAVRPRPRIVGITYPRDTWWMRLYMYGYNLYMYGYNLLNPLRRRADRYFVHRHSDVNRLMADAGYRNVHEGGTRPWRVVLHRRLATQSPRTGLGGMWLAFDDPERRQALGRTDQAGRGRHHRLDVLVGERSLLGSRLRVAEWISTPSRVISANSSSLDIVSRAAARLIRTRVRLLWTS